MGNLIIAGACDKNLTAGKQLRDTIRSSLIQLGEDVIEKQNRWPAVAFIKQLICRDTEAQRNRPLLPLTGLHSHVATVEPEAGIVAMRPGTGTAHLHVARPTVAT